MHYGQKCKGDPLNHWWFIRQRPEKNFCRRSNCGRWANGLAKSKSNVTKARPSRRQASIINESGRDSIPCKVTVETSCPAADSRSRPRSPRFSSSFSFTDALPGEYPRTVLATFPSHKQCRQEYPPPPSRDNFLVFPWWSCPLRAGRESTKPRSDVPECKACRRTLPGQSRSALIIHHG